MTRINQLSDDNANPQAAELFGAIKSKIGMVPNLYRVMANQPAVLAASLGFGEALSKGSFNAKTREAIALTVAGENACDYCASAHTAIARSLKVGDEEAARNLRGDSADPHLAAILSLAADIVRERGFVTDAQLAQAREAGLDDGAIVETIANVIANIFTNYVNHVAQTDIDFPVVKAA
ncbi:alkyl hydroperoxide reductase AhpD [Aquisalinus flavus]|uniref:Alkyl hydroperoxide reductase AhpD n=1 Tax=Aquisalinus flavus TaxID=1526572 RepID=A0A8J2V7W6_9PROT|nr:carboxymuconolactone decarboxylase family protein [Aquisalinus flavus]MBD0428111.1 carboxymuconolactone decarboxylase family protein [Aquisalinus flavus]GGD18589.1 alkyl hydroperoxide reductase AhpD [Aquisalinus flavus]